MIENPSISVSCGISDVAYNLNNIIQTSINISAPSITEQSKKKVSLALIAVIDVSISMIGSRLSLAKETLEFITRNLNNNDKFAIVTFGTTARTILSLTTMNSSGKALAIKKISNIKTRGCTNLSEGLLTGIKCLSGIDSSYSCSVMLLTDGLANTGITTSEKLIPVMERYINKIKHDINIFTFGYGLDYDENLLRSISDDTNGMHYFIQNTLDINKAFAECLGGVSNIILRSVSLKIIPKKSKIKKIHTDITNNKNRDDYILNIGNLSSGEKRNIPITIEVNKLEKPRTLSKLFTSIFSYEYNFVNSNIQCALSIPRPSPEDCKNEISKEYNEIDEQHNRVKVAEVLTKVISLSENNNISKAKQELNLLLSDLYNSSSCNSSFTKGLIFDVDECINAMEDINTFKKIGIKYLYSLSRSHYQQRASGVSSSAAAAYLTDGQREMLQSLSPNTLLDKSIKNNHKTNNSQPSIPSSINKGRFQRSIRRLMTDFAEIKKHPLPSITAEPLPNDFFEWHCNMEGPIGSVYHQVIFHIIMQFPHSYPFQPPKLFFCSYLKHENVFRTWICLDMLQEFEWSSSSEKNLPYTGWTTAYSIHSILLQLQSFLFDKADLNPNEVDKAKQSAKTFNCSNCPHKGNSKIWPIFPTSIEPNNPLESISIPKASISIPKHEPLSKLPTNTNQSDNLKILKKSSNTILKSQKDIPILNQQTHCDDKGWEIVPSRTRVSKKKLKKRQNSSNNINKILKKEPKKEDKIENTNQISNNKKHINEIHESIIKENDKPLSKSAKKNMKRRQKRKKLKQIQQISSITKDNTSTIKNDIIISSLSNEYIPTENKEKDYILKKGESGLVTSPFIYLSNELISLIFSYLNIQDLINISQCSKVFYQLANDSELWKILYSQYFPSDIIQFNPKIRFGQQILAIKAQLFCFHTRKTFEEDIIGIPISYKRNPRTKEIQYISSTLDLLSQEAYDDDNVRKTVWKSSFTHWMPLIISNKHSSNAWDKITNSIAQLCDATIFKPWMVLDVLPKLMNTMVVSVMSGETHASIVALEGYCSFHHMLLKMIKKYPELSNRIETTIKNFISSEKYRSKEHTPGLGYFLPLLAVSEKYTWKDVRNTYLQEKFDRNALWVIKKYPELKYPDKYYTQKNHINTERLQKTFDANRTSARLTAFHVYFLENIARPNGCSINTVLSKYDLFYGRPTAQMKEDLQTYCKKVLTIDYWPVFFQHIGMKVPSQKMVTYILNQAIHNSKRKGYHY